MGAVDKLCSLGDNINQYQFSNPVVQLLSDREVLTIKGNHEEIFFGPQGARARAAQSNNAELMRWLQQRPSRLRFELDGRDILLVHSTAWEPTGDYISPLTASFKRFAECGADVVFYGHTHLPVVRRVGTTLVVNPGSTGEGRPEAGGYVSSCAVYDTQTEEVLIHDFVV
jgi:putative phosphoesterase